MVEMVKSTNKADKVTLLIIRLIKGALLIIRYHIMLYI